MVDNHVEYSLGFVPHNIVHIIITIIVASMKCKYQYTDLSLPWTHLKENG